MRHGFIKYTAPSIVFLTISCVFDSKTILTEKDLIGCWGWSNQSGGLPNPWGSYRLFNVYKIDSIVYTGRTAYQSYEWVDSILEANAILSSFKILFNKIEIDGDSLHFKNGIGANIKVSLTKGDTILNESISNALYSEKYVTFKSTYTKCGD